MDYEDIVKEYKSGGLDISVLKQKLEKARPLKARPKPVDSFVVSVRAYRLFTAITNQQVVPEKPEKVERYKKETNEALQQYYLNLIEDVGRDEAWGMMGIVQQNLSQEDFTVEDGERIAQMVIARHEQADLVVVEELDET